QTVTLQASPAPASDLDVSLSLVNNAVASVPSTVTIPAGQTSTSIDETGSSNGTTILTASAVGAAAATATVAVGTHLVQWISDANGTWSNAANWSGGSLPATGDVVVID